MKTWITIALSALLVLAGCKSPPLEEIASAEAAIQAAREGEAPEYAAETFKSAEAKLEQAYNDVDAESYEVARSNAVSAKELAEAALREARKRKAENELQAKKDQEARAAKGEFAPEVEASVKQESLTGAGVASKELPPVFFDFDSYNIRADQRDILDSAVEWLIEHPEIRVRLEGHTDERGEAEYNLALGRRRSLAVKDDLVAAGVSSARIQTVSLGEEDPLDYESSEKAWATNRRVEFMMLRPNEEPGTN